MLAAVIIGGFVVVAAGDKKPEDVFERVDSSAERILAQLTEIETTLKAIEQKLGE